MKIKKYPYKTILIGAGAMGCYHARVLAQSSQLVAIVDTNIKRAKTLATQYHCHAYDKLSICLKTENPDAATIAVPTRYHYIVAQQTLNAGIPTLVEKPIAQTTTQAQKLIALAQKQNILLMVGHLERHNPAVIKLKSLIDQGHFGSLTSLLAIRVGLNPPADPKADVITDLAIHDLDIFNWLLHATPTFVHLTSQRQTAHLADNAGILCRYQGCLGLIQVNWLTPIKIRQLHLTGTRAYAVLDYIRQTITLYHRLDSIPQANSFTDIQTKYQSQKQILRPHPSEPLAAEIRAFLAQAKTRPPNLEPTHQAYLALKHLTQATRL